MVCNKQEYRFYGYIRNIPSRLIELNDIGNNMRHKLCHTIVYNIDIFMFVLHFWLQQC